MADNGNIVKIRWKPNTNFCMDTRYMSSNNNQGAPYNQQVSKWGLNQCADVPEQAFKILSGKGGSQNHAIQNMKTGQCIDGGGSLRGQQVVLTDCDGTNDWRTQFEFLGGFADGVGIRVNTRGGWNECIDIGNDALAAPCGGGNENQRFDFPGATYPPNTSPAPAVADTPGLAKLGDSFSRGSGYCLDSGQWPAIQNEGSTSPSWGTYACNPNNPHHKFFIDDKGQFVSYQSGKCLDNFGTNNWQWNNCNEGANQTGFSVTTDKNLIKQGTRCLDVGNSAHNYDCNSSNANQAMKNLDLKQTFANTGPMACEGQKNVICCPVNQVIDSGTIKVGRFDNTTCPGEGVKSDTGKNYFYTPLPNKCIGAQGCTINWSIEDLSDVGSHDPAPGIPKQYQALYNCVKNATPLSEITIASLLASKPPWAVYGAESFANNSLPDLRGTAGRNATCVNVNLDNAATNGAAVKIPFIFGGTTATVEWPTGSIPANFTICSITRYNGASKSRILVGKTDNWLHGHWGGRRGVCHYDTWITDHQNVGTVDDWVVVCGKNNGTAPNNILVDGTPSGINPGGSGGKTLTINKYTGGETSDWALSYVFIWDQNLTDAEMVVVSNTLKQYLMDGVSLKALVNVKVTSPPAPTIKDYTFTFDVQCTKDNCQQTCYVSNKQVSKEYWTWWCKGEGGNQGEVMMGDQSYINTTDKTFFSSWNASDVSVKGSSKCWISNNCDRNNRPPCCGSHGGSSGGGECSDKNCIGWKNFNVTERCDGTNNVGILYVTAKNSYYKPKQENYWYWDCAIGPKAPPTFSTFINASGSVSTDNKEPAFAVFSVTYSINFTAKNVTTEMLDALFKMVGTGSRTLYSIKQNSATVKKMLTDFCNAKEYVQYLPSNVCGPNYDIMGSYFSNYSIDGVPTNVFACDDTYTSCQKGWINYCNSPDTFSGNDCQNFYAASYSSNPTTKTSEINPNVKTLLKNVCTNLCIVNGKLKEEIDPTVQSICGCYLPDTIYNGFKATVSQANPSIAAFLTAPQCYFPMCVNNASLWQAKPFECPSATLTQCITNTTNNLNAGGDISNVKLQNNAVQNCSASSSEGKAPATTSKNESGNAPAPTPASTPTPAPAGAPMPKFICIIL